VATLQLVGFVGCGRDAAASGESSHRDSSTAPLVFPCQRLFGCLSTLVVVVRVLAQRALLVVFAWWSHMYV
jgi:hypothetical protein